MTEQTKPVQKPVKRLFAVSKREKGDKRSADWFEVGAEWATSNGSITSLSQNDAFMPLIASGQFDLVLKTIDPAE